MENSKLLATLRAFKALFENLPSELPDEKYTHAYEQLDESFMTMLYSLLATQHFAMCIDSDGEHVSIFDTKTDRDSYVETMRQFERERRERDNITTMPEDYYERLKSGEIVCYPITPEDFLYFAETEEFNLDNYSLDEDGAIEFERGSDSVKTAV